MLNILTQQINAPELGSVIFKTEFPFGSTGHSFGSAVCVSLADGEEPVAWKCGKVQMAGGNWVSDPVGQRNAEGGHHHASQNHSKEHGFTPVGKTKLHNTLWHNRIHACLICIPSQSTKIDC